MSHFSSKSSAEIPDAICFVLAGGNGERLRPLTASMPKPLLDFGAVHRLIDFTLSNVRNSDLPQAYVLSQFRHEAIGRHLRARWSSGGTPSGPIGPVILNQPPTSGRRYRGTADAVAQNLDVVDLSARSSAPVLVLSADHVYRMDYRKLLVHHLEAGAGVTVAATTVPIDWAKHFGVIAADPAGRIVGFEEKPRAPSCLADAPDLSLVNMGVYVFDRRLLKLAIGDLEATEPRLDFGRHLLPWMVDRGQAGVYQVPEEGRGFYWRDVGTLDSYHASHMDFLAGQSGFDTVDADWPIAAFEGRVTRIASGVADRAQRSLMATSSFVGDARFERSVAGQGAIVEDGADVRDSILLPGARVGAGAIVRQAIVAERGIVGAGDRIGCERDRDLERFGVTESGLVIVPPGPCVRVRRPSSRWAHSNSRLMAG